MFISFLIIGEKNEDKEHQLSDGNKQAWHVSVQHCFSFCYYTSPLYVFI